MSEERCSIMGVTYQPRVFPFPKIQQCGQTIYIIHIGKFYFMQFTNTVATCGAAGLHQFSKHIMTPCKYTKEPLSVTQEK